MMKRIAMIALVSGALLLWFGHAGAADQPVMDSRYLKEHFPEVYRQIYQEGREAGRKEAEEALKSGAPPAPAAAGPALPAAVPVAVQQAKPDLGAWWEKSALKYSPVPEQWLFHAEGTLDLKYKTGNTKSDRYSGSASLTVRKSRFTNTLSFMIEKEYSEDLSPSGSYTKSKDEDSRSIQDALRYDLTERFYAEGGYMWEKDKKNYITGRDSYYAGLGYTLVDTQRHHLDVFFAGGYVNEKYPSLIQSSMNLDHLEVGAAYFRQDYRWNITDRLTFKETFRIIQNLKSTEVFNDDVNRLQVIGETYRYRWFLINEIYFKLMPHVNFMIGYKYEFDSNPWPTVDRTDTTLKSGIQFSY